MDRHERRITHAYVIGVDLRNELRDGASLCAAIESIDGPFEMLDDGYPAWHLGPHPFEGILKLFYYREITGQSYRGLAEYPELADTFGLDRIPRESVFSRAWRDRFDDDVREITCIGPSGHWSNKRKSTSRSRRYSATASSIPGECSRPWRTSTSTT